MQSHAKPLGILAGSGPLPVMAARLARKAGRKVVAVQLAETGQMGLDQAADATLTISLGKVETILDFLKNHLVEEVLYIGKVPKQLHFAEIQFDRVALMMLARLPGRSDGSIFAVIAEEMESRGFRIVPQSETFAPLLAPAGHLAGPEAGKQMQADVEFGRNVALRLADLDVGQTVIVTNGAVVAVEAFEHTDATIKRAGMLAGKNLVVVKMARPKQDPRFDLPTVGPATLAVLRKAGGRCLAVEAGKTLMIDPKRMKSYARRHGITVLGISRESSGGTD